MAEMAADGESESRINQKANVVRIFEAFLAQDQETTGKWDSQVEETLFSPAIYQRLAHFRVHVYMYTIPKGKKKAGNPLACDSVINYLGTAINRAADKFKHGAGDPPDGLSKKLGGVVRESSGKMRLKGGRILVKQLLQSTGEHTE